MGRNDGNLDLLVVTPIITKRRRGENVLQKRRVSLLLALIFVAIVYARSETLILKAEEAIESSAEYGVQVGKKAAPFTLQTLKGDTVSLEDFQGKNVVVHFFATWRFPCQEEMPLIVELDKKLKEKGDVLLAVNLTSEEHDKGASLKQFLTHYRATFDPLLDVDGDVGALYNLLGIPTTIVIDEEGTIVKRINGQMSYSMMEAIVR